MYHDFEAGKHHPDSEDEFGFIDMKCPKCEHKHDPNGDKNSLSEARIHCPDMDISSVVEFFEEKDTACEEAGTCEKKSETHEGKSNLRLRYGVHIKEEKHDR